MDRLGDREYVRFLNMKRALLQRVIRQLAEQRLPVPDPFPSSYAALVSLHDDLRTLQGYALQAFAARVTPQAHHPP